MEATWKIDLKMAALTYCTNQDGLDGSELV